MNRHLYNKKNKTVTEFMERFKESFSSVFSIYGVRLSGFFEWMGWLVGWFVERVE